MFLGEIYEVKSYFFDPLTSDKGYWNPSVGLIYSYNEDGLTFSKNSRTDTLYNLVGYEFSGDFAVEFDITTEAKFGLVFGVFFNVTNIWNDAPRVVYWNTSHRHFWFYNYDKRIKKQIFNCDAPFFELYTGHIRFELYKSLNNIKVYFNDILIHDYN